MNKHFLELQWPPTVNHYWGQSGKRRFIGKKGVEFRKHVERVFLCKSDHKMLRGRLKVDVTLFQTCKRRKDIDNILKPLLDAMEKAGVYENDSQIDELNVNRVFLAVKDKEPSCQVWVSEINESIVNVDKLRKAGL